MKDDIAKLHGQLNDPQRRVLAVLACERSLTMSALERLDASDDLRHWLTSAVGQGLLVDRGILYGMPYTRSIAGERALAIEPTLRAAFLRRVAEAQGLARAAIDARKIAGEHTIAGFVSALYAGDLTALERETSLVMRRSVRGEEARLLRDLLRDAVCESLDDDWLPRTWGKNAWLLIEQVLSDALVTLEPIGNLYDFVVSKIAHVSPRVLVAVAEHAWLRQDQAVLGQAISALPSSRQPPLRGMLRILEGDLGHVQALLNDVVIRKSTERLLTVWPVSLVVVLATLALTREPAEGSMLAKRLLRQLAHREPVSLSGWPAVPYETQVAKAARSLLRRLIAPEREHSRLSSHQQPSDAPAWETLLMALTAQVDDSDRVTRIGWARRLIVDAARWQANGYPWMTRQAQHLAKALSPEPVPELERFDDLARGELVLAGLLEREPEYRRALRALEQLADSIEAKDRVVSRRVAWYLDMTYGELAKPALDEYRPDTGWARGRRMDFDELRSQRESLPPEDIAVLTAIDASPRLGRMPPEAIEALCGHPRVFNGNRGRQPVEVVRGHCRVETTQERGHFVIRTEPSGAEEGVHVVVESETRVVVYRVEAAFARLNAMLSGGLRIPSNQKQEGLAVLARLAPHVEIRSPELGAFRALRADVGPCLRISSDAGAFWVEVGVRPFGELGRFFPPGLGRSSVTVHAGNDLFEAERDPNEELAQFGKLLALCPTLEAALKREAEAAGNVDEQRFCATLGEEELFGLLTELREAYPNCPIEWKTGRAIASRGKLSSTSLQGSLRRVKGWYIIDGTVTLGEVTEQSIGELLRMPYTKSGRFLRLPNGDFVEVERRVRQLLTRLANVGELSARHSPSEIRLPDAAFDTVHSLLELAGEIRADASVTEWLSHVDATLKSEPKLPEGLLATLRPYQVEGYQWLHRYSRLGLGVCLADDMGLGKTLQVIALLLTRAEGGPALVVAPTSVCSNWLDELTRFAPSLTCAEYTGRTRAALLEGLGEPVAAQSGTPRLDVVIVSYALLQQDSDQLTALEWHTAVLDEAQFIKNPHSRRAKAAYRLKSRYRLAMTGTPVENHLGDLWSLFHFLNPSLLGSLKHFQLRYTRPIERDRDSDQQVALKRLVQPFLLRRTKDEVLRDLPPLTILRHEICWSDDEAMRYALLRKNIHEKLSTPQTRRDNKLEILAEITRLRRFCCHPRLVFPDAPTDSSKLQSFLELVDEMRDNGHRALVFSQFVDFLELVREQLDERGVKYIYLDGSTKKEARRTRVRAFQAGEGELFLISLKAGGFGLNLTGADYVIHLDPWWNPAVEAQASDRAHRIGQQRPVTVYRLVTKNSIEERILNLHHEKRAIADALLDGTSVATQLSEDELLTLLMGEG